MSSVNLYEVLGVSSDADEPSIERAFKDISLKLHPDKANISTAPGVETEAEREARQQRNHEIFVKIIYARNILTDRVKRRSYDQERRRKKLLGSTGHQEDSAETIRRLKKLTLKVNNLLGSFRELRPQSRTSLTLPGHLEIISLFNRVVSIHAEVTNRVTKKPPSSYSPNNDKPAMRDAKTHILLIGALVSELDALLDQHKTYVARDLLYYNLRAAFSKFLNS
ncbi:hypothetical protein RRF57_012791 [Xylaria bambusicola]|uniref:J domain-containing protein n=1 Tax=Xylaria bambusicola TaxID=326684 RepID=A0AAN7V4K4_9PEZI